MRVKYLLTGACLALVLLALPACDVNPVPTPTAVVVEIPAACPSPIACVSLATPTPSPARDVPFQSAWEKSAHADAKAAAFTHWDTDPKKLVPVDCAKCHSTPGFLDFIGADGSPTGTVDAPAPIGSVITCTACHNDQTAAMTAVTFPSGAHISGLGSEARCMQCHQGRASVTQINDALVKAGLDKDIDKVDPELGFLNIHYFAAAATQYGAQVKGGYEYPGRSYDIKFDHVAGYNTCIGCHDPHSLQIKIDQCAVCHKDVKSKDDLKNIRMAGSASDYNGIGDTKEGIAREIEGLQGLLLQAIQAYAKEKSGKAVAYNPDSYPYFFVDTNGNGQVDAAEAKSDNAYNAWTARLLKAAYNYQTSIKDPGAFAHNAKYIIELLYDSIDDLNQAISNKVDLSKASRSDPGHFAGSNEAFRHWDSDPSGKVPGACARCHSAAGLPFYLSEGLNISAPISNGLNCATCHDDLTKFSRYVAGPVTFPSGARLDSGSADSNLCLNCHQGRESTVSINQTIAKSGAKDNEVSSKLSFRNPHYFAAGATLFGTVAKGAYEYDGQLYVGRFKHIEAFDTCTECHDTHAQTVKIDQCATCHGDFKTQEDLKKITSPAGNTIDFAGDGNPNEGMGLQIARMQQELYTAIQDYAVKTAKTSIVYSNSSYPYFFIDTNNNGKLDPDEAVALNAYASWTPRLLKAAYNYQWSVKDPGVYAHNAYYILQVMYDSLKDLGGDVKSLTRPPMPEKAK